MSQPLYSLNDGQPIHHPADMEFDDGVSGAPMFLNKRRTIPATPNGWPAQVIATFSHSGTTNANPFWWLRSNIRTAISLPAGVRLDAIGGVSGASFYGWEGSTYFRNVPLGLWWAYDVYLYAEPEYVDPVGYYVYMNVWPRTGDGNTFGNTQMFPDGLFLGQPGSYIRYYLTLDGSNGPNSFWSATPITSYKGLGSYEEAVGLSCVITAA